MAVQSSVDVSSGDSDVPDVTCSGDAKGSVADSQPRTADNQRR